MTIPPVSIPLAACLAQAQGEPAAPLVLQYLPLVAIALAAYFLLFRPERERLRRQQELHAGLKKNDRVVTSSGIYGTVANVDRDAERVILKVDDAANVKLTVSLSSVARVLDDDGAAPPSPGAST